VHWTLKTTQNFYGENEPKLIHKRIENVGCKSLNFYDNNVNKSHNYFLHRPLKICSLKVHTKLIGYPYSENSKVILFTFPSESGITFENPLIPIVTRKNQM
jgi:hypothetical protein